MVQRWPANHARWGPGVQLCWAVLIGKVFDRPIPLFFWRPDIILVKTRYQENIIASTCFRKLISGALRWGALKTSNVTSISFPTWSWVDSIKINFLRLSAVLRVRLETLAPQAFQSAYSSNKGEGSSSSFIVGIFSVINLHYFDTGLGSWGQTISSFSWTLSTTSVHFRSERSTS